MLLPIGTDRPLSRPTVINHALVAVNVAVFLAGLVAERFAGDAFEQIAGPLILDPERFRVWTLVTYAFLHGGFMHLLGNMVFLWVFGPNVEDRLGRIGYLAFYLLGAAISGGMHALFNGAPVVGASGAIAGVTGAYLVLFPRTQIKTVVIFFLIGVYEIPAWWFIGGQIAWNLFMEAGGLSGNIATLAHLGGYGYGAAVSAALLGSGLLKREVYDLFTISRQARRRREFREVQYQRRRAELAGKNPDMALKPRSADEASIDAVAALRAEIADKLESGEAPAAASAYRTLMERHSAVPGAALLPRRTQYDIANALFAAGDHATALSAYDTFLAGYPKDPEIPTVRLMVGVICARYLNDPVRAKKEIVAAKPDLTDGHLALAAELLEELG